MRSLRSITRFLRDDERGATTVEWVIIFPTIFTIVLAAIESGVMMSRYMLLDRATDIAAREIRLGNLADNDGSGSLQEEVRAIICDHARLPACETSTLIELVRKADADPSFPDNAATCQNRDTPVDPVDQPSFSDGGRAEIMYIRICALAEPFLPGIGFGLLLPKDADGAHRMITYTAFMNEPGAG